MYNIRYLLAKVKFKILGNNKEIISDYFRKYGMKIGGRCDFFKYYDARTLSN